MQFCSRCEGAEKSEILGSSLLCEECKAQEGINTVKAMDQEALYALRLARKIILGFYGHKNMTMDIVEETLEIINKVLEGK